MFTCTACLRRCIALLSANSPLTSASPFPSSTCSRVVPISASASLTWASSNANRRSLGRSNSAFIRTTATFRGLNKSHHLRIGLQAVQNAKSIKAIARNTTRNPMRMSRRENRDVLARQNNSARLNTDQGERNLQLQADKEAVFLIDPLQLAQTVADNLRNDDFDKAYNLVLASDRAGLKRGVPQGGVRNIVSWNHLIDWTMAQHEYMRAMQIYQGMKKRGHVPDSHTYLLILRGLGRGIKSADDVARKTGWSRGVRGMDRVAGNKYLVTQAMEVYNSIFRPNSEVQVKTLHSNALINVLARAGDMDALWGVTGRLPEKGHGSADHWTYTTILHAMRQDLSLKMRKAMDGEVQQSEALVKLDALVEDAMRDARQLWRDVIIRWRSVQLQMDEKLVAAMARLLLWSKKPRRIQDVFALTRQTMGLTVDEELITRMRKELAKTTVVEAKQRDVAAAQAEEKEEEEDDDDDAVVNPESEQASVEELAHGYPGVDPATSEMELQVFEPVAMDVNAMANHALYAKPDNNTLSFLLDAATLLRRPAVGKAYWELLTSKSGPYRVVPDAASLMNYLRLLRLSRSSQAALDVLKGEWEGEAAEIMNRRGTFVVAMSACIRDKSNPNAFGIASRMLDVMQDHATNTQIERDEEEDIAAMARENLPPGTKGPKRGVTPMEALPLDPKVLQMYLELAMFTTKGINRQLPLSKLRSGDLDYARDPMQNNTMRALTRLRPDVVNIHRMLNMALDQIDYQKKMDRLPASIARRRLKPRAETAEQPEELLAFLQTVISAYDRIQVVNFRLEEEGLGPLDQQILTEVKLQKAKMSDYVRRLKKALTGYLDEDALQQTQKRYSPTEDGEFDDDDDDDAAAAAEATEVSAVDSISRPRQSPSVESRRWQKDRPGSSFNNSIFGDETRPTREAQYSRYAQDSDRFQQHVRGLRNQGTPLTRRQKKFETWLGAKGDVRGPQPAFTREARELEFHQLQSTAPRPVGGGLGVLGGGGSSIGGGGGEEFRRVSSQSSDRFRKRDEMLASASASASSSSSAPSSRFSRQLSVGLRRDPASMVKRDGKVVRKRLSKRQKQEYERERRDDSVRRDMVRFGASEKAVRARRAGVKEHGSAGSAARGRRRGWLPSGEIHRRMGAATAGSG